MKTHLSPRNKSKLNSGFTLIELLVVISIIAILASLGFAASQGVLRKAKKVSAENTAQNLKASISAYFTEYRKYPVKVTSGDTDKELLSDNELMDVLLGADSEATAGGLNPRKITFFEGKAARQKGAGKYSGGVRLGEGGTGQLYDPYGGFFHVTLDTDYNSRVKAPDWDTKNTELPTSVIVWSAGADEKDSTAEDNVKTW